MNTENNRQATAKGTGMPALGESLVVLCLSMGIMLLTVRAFRVIEPGISTPIGDSRFTMGLWIELLAIGLPLALLFSVRRYNLSQSLGLAGGRLSSLAGGGLMGAGTVLFVPQLDAWLARYIPPPEGYFETIVDFFTLKSGESLAWALFCMALIPALFEEALFRGILLRSALVRMRPPAAIVGVGAAFALFHLDIWHAPVLCLIGMLITWIAIRTASLWPAVVFHLVHNSLSLIMLNLRITGDRGWIEGSADVPAPLLALGAFLFIAGAVILPQKRPRGKTGSQKVEPA
ncbi:MAG: CPBP family intramembrane metalloprotease [Deltaproteobacteria bacterium]|nr:CPBP family intramembrane metalloprotease [Deltaproteobacteria bacterium]